MSSSLYRRWVKRFFGASVRSRTSSPRHRRGGQPHLSLEHLETRIVPAPLAPGKYSGIIASNESFLSTTGTYEINGFLKIEPGATLTIGPGVTVQLDEGETITVDGALTIEPPAGPAGPAQIVAENGTAKTIDGIIIDADGTLNASVGMFSLSSTTGTDTAFIDVTPGATVNANLCTFGWNQFTYDPQNTAGTNQVVFNTFNTTLSTRATDVGFLTDNKSFQAIDILPNDQLPTSQVAELGPIGTTSTANLVYVFSQGFTVDSESSLEIGSVHVVLDEGTTFVVDGTLQIDSGAVISAQKSTNGLTTGIQDNGLVTATGASFQNATISGSGTTPDTTLIDVNSGGEFQAKNCVFGWDQFNYAPGSQLLATDLTGNAFDTTLSVEAAQVALLTNNQNFHDIDLLPNDVVSPGETVNLGAIGQLTTANLRYVIPGPFTVQPGGMLTVQDASLLIREGQTLTDDGFINVVNSDVEIEDFGNGVSGGIMVNGELDSSNSTFTRVSGNGSDFTSIEIGNDGVLHASGSTFGWDQLTFDSSVAIQNNSLTGNAFDTTLAVPVVDVPELSNNQSFQAIDINAGDQVASGEDIVFGAIGTVSTAGLSYNFLGAFTVDSGGKLEIGQNVETVLAPGFTVTVDGTLQLDSGATLLAPDTTNGFSTGVLVNGTLTATSASFQKLGGTSGSDTLYVQVSSGGHLIASNTTFAWDQVNLNSGSILNSGDLTGDTFATTVTVPAADVALLSNNQSFQNVDILPGDSVGSGSTVTLGLIGKSTANLRYVFSGVFTVQSGGTLVFGDGINVLITEGQILNDQGTLHVNAGDTVTIQDLNNSLASGIFVGGTLDAAQATFTRGAAGNGSDFTSIEIGSGGTLNASASTFSLDQLTLDAGSTDTLNNNTLITTLSVDGGITTGSSITLNDLSNTATKVVATGNSTEIINLTNNYWNTTSTTAIEAKITDQRTNPALPLVNFLPVDTTPLSQTAAVGATATFSLRAQTLILTADVTSSSGTVNQGTVTFTILSGGTTIGQPVTSLPVKNGVATANFVLPAATAPGSYTIDAVYNGGTGLSGSSDSSQDLTVLQASTTTVAANALASFSYSQQPVVLSASVSSSAGNLSEGSVTFTVFNFTTGVQVGSAVSGSVTNGFASATFQLPAGSPAGTYKINATYGGDANLLSSSDNIRTLTVGKTGTSVSVNNNPATFSYAAQVITLDATILSNAGAAQEGTVTFTLTTPLGTSLGTTTGSVSGGRASANITLPAAAAPGAYSVLAVYSGGPDLLGSSSNPLGTETVNAAATTTATSNVSTSFDASAQSVPLTATVSSPAGTVIEGNVTFSLFNGNSLVSTLTSSTVSGGTAGVNLPLPAGLAPGTYSIHAGYSGTTDLVASADTTHTLTIGAAATSTQANNTTVSFSESAQFVTVSAALTSSAGGVNQGSVTFTVVNGGNTIATATVSASGSSTVSAQVVLPADLAPGTYTIDTVYSGGTEFQGSSDNTHSLTVSKASTTSTASSLTASFSDNSQTLSLSTVVASPAGVVSGGTVTFTLFNAAQQQVGAPVTSNTDSASFVLPAGAAVGTYTIDASFSGGTDFLQSTDTTGTLTVGQTSTTTSVAAATSTFSGSSPQVTLHATLASTNGPVEEGTFVFTVLSGSTVIGAPVTVAVTGDAVSATYSLPPGTAPGTYTLLGQYSDSPANFIASNNSLAPTTLTVGLAPTTTAVTNTTVTATTSQPVVLVATVSSPGGQINQGTITFSVFSGNTEIGVPVTSGTVGAGSAKATFTVPAGTPAGTYTIQAVYNGGPNFQASPPATGTLQLDQPPVFPLLNSGNPITLSHDLFPYSAALGASSPLDNPLTYTTRVVGDSVPFDLMQQYQFQGLGYATAGATAYVLQSATSNSFGNQFYLLRPSDGALYAYDGSGSYAHTFTNGTPLATLGADTYTDPTLLLNAQAPVDYTTLYNLQQHYQFTGVGYATAGATAYVLHSNQAGPGVGGYYLLRSNGALFAYDGSGSYTSSFASSAPIATLDPNVYLFPSELTNAEAAPSLYAQLYLLNQQYDLQEIGGSFHTNTLGHQAQWIYSPVLNQFGQHWYTLTLNTGGTQALLRPWDGSQDSATGPVIATLDPSVYNNPALLTNATALPNPAVSASVNGSGHLLVALPNLNAYTGTFKVIVTASDGFLSTAQTVLFNAADSAPTLTVSNSGTTIAPGGTQTVGHSNFPVTDTVATSDPEGDSVTSSASVTSFSLPYSLQVQYRFTGLGYFTAGSAAYVLQSAGNNSFGNPYYLLSASGGLYAYDGSGSYAHTIANVTPLATLGANFYSDPTLLTGAVAPLDYTTLYNLEQQYQFTVVGTFSAGAPAVVLHSNQAGTGVGGYYLLSTNGGLYAYDGSGSYGHTFANSTPLATLDPSVYTNPSLLLNAKAAPGLYVQLYQSEQQFDLQEFGGSFYTGLEGNTAKWLYSPVANADGQHWYTLVLSSDGNQALLYAWDGGTNSIPAGATPVAAFDPSVYADPTLLTNAKAPLAAVGVTASLSGGSLTLNAPSSFVGTFQVTVTATDGLKSTSQTFLVTSTDAPPALNPIAQQTLSLSTGSLQVPLSATTADSAPVTFSATVTGYSPAYNLQQVYHFTGVGFVNNGGVTAYVMTSSVLGGVSGYYLLKSDGGVYAYDGSGSYAHTFANSANLITTLDPSVYTTPTLLTNALVAPAPGVTYTVSGNTLTITPAGVTAGTVFEVFVTASDGAETTRTGFLVTVTV